jgi:hypothetical protein
MSAIAVPVSLPDVVSSVLSWPQFVFAVWISVGVLALIIGFAAVRASTRRLRRSARLGEQEVAFGNPGSSKQSAIRAAA